MFFCWLARDVNRCQKIQSRCRFHSSTNDSWFSLFEAFTKEKVKPHWVPVIVADADTTTKQDNFIAGFLSSPCFVTVIVGGMQFDGRIPHKCWRQEDSQTTRASTSASQAIVSNLLLLIFFHFQDHLVTLLPFLIGGHISYNNRSCHFSYHFNGHHDFSHYNYYNHYHHQHHHHYNDYNYNHYHTSPSTAGIYGNLSAATCLPDDSLI